MSHIAIRAATDAQDDRVPYLHFRWCCCEADMIGGLAGVALLANELRHRGTKGRVVRSRLRQHSCE